MKLKLDANGNAVLVDGKPVYIHDDGKEIPFDAAGTVATIARLNSEARDHRVGKEEALAKLKLFEGIEDPKKAIEALKTVSNIDMKKLVDAGQLEEVRNQISQVYEGKLKTADERASKFEQQLYSALIGSAFASAADSKKFAVPADMLQAKFGSQFKVEDGKVIGYDANGNKLFSRERPGEIAPFAEALNLIVDSYQHKDHILVGSTHSGGGSAQSGAGNTGGQTIRRADFMAMPPQTQAATVKAGTKIID